MIEPRHSYCDRCGGKLTCGQPGRHWTCADRCNGCRVPVIRSGRALINCRCSATTQRKAVA